MKITGIQLVTTKTAVGKGANDGIYPPAGLLTIASALRAAYGENLKIWVDDQHHGPIMIQERADLVGIQVASTLTYKIALDIAAQAKAAGKIVVLGGPHATALPEQILRNRPFVDFLIRGKGEEPMIQLMEAIEGHRHISAVESLSWRDKDRIIHNDWRQPELWDYDRYTPLPLHLLSAGIEKYWSTFQKIIDPSVHAAFLVFTHFGCGYRAQMEKKKQPFCIFCSLGDPPLARNPQKILAEVKCYMDTYCKKGDRVHLKCYGDNIGWQGELVQKLRQAISRCSWWNDYAITWTFYCQSSRLTEKLAADLRAIGTTHLFIGFDSADDKVQRLNRLGTSHKSHERIVERCLKSGIKIQVSSVVGLWGENPETLETNLQFYRWLINTGAVERINSAVLFIIPRSFAFKMLASKEPWIHDLDLLSTNEIRKLWIKHFCPTVSLEMLQEYANRIDALSPGPHASMGYDSQLLKTPC